MDEINRFWTCWVEHSNGGYGYRHTSREAACLEAERLAQLTSNRGKVIFVLEMVASCRMRVPVEWQTIIPF